MRAHLLTLAAATAVITLTVGTASAQQYRGFYRPSYGTPNTSMYRPSNFGMTRPSGFVPSNFGNPGAGPWNAANGSALNAGSAVPIGALNSLPGVAFSGGLAGYAGATPLTGNAAFPTVTAPVVGNAPAQFNDAFGPNTVQGAPAGAPTVEVPGPLQVPTQFVPLYPQASASMLGYSNGIATYGSGATLGRPGYGSVYSAPQYQSSFFEPLRRVYQGY